MLVTGDGEQIPHTDKFIYDDERVIAIFEVKKTLTKSTLHDALELFRDYYDNVAKRTKVQFDTLQDSWRNLFGENLHALDIDALPPHKRAVRWALAQEGLTPLRVVYAFTGYKSAFGLRAGILDYLKWLISQNVGWNLVRLPTLVICGNHSILKCDGGPYVGQYKDDHWLFLGSRTGQPWRLLLECLWTRLAYLFKIGDGIFGEDQEVEAITPLLGGRAQIANDRGEIGWEYLTHVEPRKHLREPEPTRPWVPAELNEYEGIIVWLLLQGNEIFVNDEEFANFLKKHGTEPRAAVDGLQAKRIVSVHNGKLELLTDNGAVVFMPDGRTVAGENKSGRLQRYVLKETLRPDEN